VWVGAYAEHHPGFGENLREILMDLSSRRSDDFERIFQKGLFSILSEEKLETLESRLDHALSRARLMTMYPH
jgi:ribosomal protein S4